MSQIVEVNEEGGLYLPSDLLAELPGKAKPHTRYVLEAQGESIILTRLEQARPLWATATPEERSKAFRRWATDHKGREDGPGLPDEALRRENMYKGRDACY